MRTFVLLVLSSGLLGIACMPLQATERLAPTSTATATPTATATATFTAASNSTPAETDMPAATPEPTRISEVLPVDQPPVSVPIRGGTVLPMPAGTSVVWGGCSSDGQCHWFNFYWAPTHEAVLQNGESQVKVQHELCHAHQHWTISGGAALNPTNYDLHTWYDTAEGQSFAGAVSGLDWPWNHSAQDALEDFAWTCAYWYVDPAYLQQVSPARYDWAAANLP